MICSLWKIEFVTASATYVLLDHVDMVESEPEFPWDQQSAVTAPIFQKYSSSAPLGGVAASSSWTRIRTVNRPRSTALLDSIQFPWGVTGYLRFTIAGGAAFVFLRSCIKGISPSYEIAPNFLLQAYTAELGPPSLPEFSSSALLHATRAVSTAGDIFAPTISGGASPYAAAIFEGALPAGYALTTSGVGCGKITGTPTTPGVYSWTVALSDARGARILYDQTITITP